MVKSTGWKGELPRPASADASIRPASPCALAAASAASTKQDSAANSTGRAADAVDQELASARPMPEITKKVLTSRPSSGS